MTRPRREQRRQKAAITRMLPLHPYWEISAEASGENMKVPAPEPQVEIPVARLSRLEKYWPTVTTAGG